MIITLLAFFGCKAKKQLVAVHKPDTVVKKADTVATVKTTIPHLSPDQINAIQAKQINFMTFSAKAKAKISIDGNNNDVTLNIRIKKNQQIWVSITALLGIEGARALITADSIKIINRLEGTYLKKPFSYIYKYAGNQVSYQTLEALIIGNAWPGTVNSDAALQNLNGNLILNGNLNDLLYQILIGADSRINKTSLSSTTPYRTLQVEYSGAFPAADRIIPAQISISSSAQNSKINIGLTYTKAEFNTNVEFPFAVPARYPVVN